MRAALIALAVLGLPAVGHAETMLLKNPSGIMCRDEKSLGDFSGNDGAVKPGVMANSFSPIAKRYMGACQGGGFEVQVVTKRVNTSIVTYRGQTWYVPNIDYMTPTPDCIKAGARVTFTGKVETGNQHTTEDNSGPVTHYPRLTLDKPVCFLGNYADPAARYMSLVGNGADGYRKVMGMMGRHVTAAGTVESPDNGNQPPDLMMMFDPVIRPAP